jgi:hypothetical protein
MWLRQDLAVWNVSCTGTCGVGSENVIPLDVVLTDERGQKVAGGSVQDQMAPRMRRFPPDEFTVALLDGLPEVPPTLNVIEFPDVFGTAMSRLPCAGLPGAALTTRWIAEPGEAVVELAAGGAFAPFFSGCAVTAAVALTGVPGAGGASSATFGVGRAPGLPNRADSTTGTDGLSTVNLTCEPDDVRTRTGQNDFDGKRHAQWTPEIWSPGELTWIVAVWWSEVPETVDVATNVVEPVWSIATVRVLVAAVVGTRVMTDTGFPPLTWTELLGFEPLTPDESCRSGPDEALPWLVLCAPVRVVVVELVELVELDFDDPPHPAIASTSKATTMDRDTRLTSAAA